MNSNQKIRSWLMRRYNVKSLLKRAWNRQKNCLKRSWNKLKNKNKVFPRAKLNWRITISNNIIKRIRLRDNPTCIKDLWKLNYPNRCSRALQVQLILRKKREFNKDRKPKKEKTTYSKERRERKECHLFRLLKI